MHANGSARSLAARSGGAGTAQVARPTASRGRLRRSVVVQCLSIDRRAHLELAWRRQEARAESLAQADFSQGGNGIVHTVDDLEHLEQLLEKAGSNVVILMFTSRTCGVCKAAAAKFQRMASDAAAARARVVFLSADTHTEYDTYSDVARWHKVKAVPTFLFIDEGAVIKRLSLRDVRRLTGSTAWIQMAMKDDLNRLRDAFTEVLFRRAPSTRS